MLKAHMDAVEGHLLSTSQIPANSGHSLHKGTPREAFVRTFLEDHLPQTVGIGTGEIIDANSRPGEQRNQHDIVIYRKDYPKLDFGGVYGFLIESVVATIEVKSELTQSGFRNAIGAAINAKSLDPNFTEVFRAGAIPPKVLNYIVAYDGPATIETVYGWIGPVYEEFGITQPNLPVDPDERLLVPSESIDGAFVLGKGFMFFDNRDLTFAQMAAMRSERPDIRWVFSNGQDANLLTLFILLQSAISNLAGRWLDPLPYLPSVDQRQFGAGSG